MPAWSYSSVKLFDQCPRKYNHLRVLKDVKEESSEHLTYGKEVHKAAEDYVKQDTPIPDNLQHTVPVIDALKNKPGEKHCELRLGVEKQGDEYTPCGFFANNVWLRTVVDLLIVDGTEGWLIDYKTGKNVRYADARQLHVMAGASFVHYPQLKTIKAGLAYLDTDDIIKESYAAEDKVACLNTFSSQLDRLQGAVDSGVWNANPGPLCGWCPVVNCEHHRER